MWRALPAESRRLLQPDLGAADTNTEPAGLCWELQASGDVLLARLAGGGSHPNVTGSFGSPSCPPLPRMAVAALSMGCALVPAELVLPPGGVPSYTLTSPSHHSCCLTSGAG